MVALKLCSFLIILTSWCILTFSQEYHVKDFGAIGDGKTDDTNAVRAAVAAAASTNGGRVIFDVGYTFLTGCFNASSNIILDIRGTILGSNLSDHYM
jgi:polygalacturonase